MTDRRGISAPASSTAAVMPLPLLLLLLVLQLNALEQGRRQWEEAQRRCEVWAYKRATSDFTTGRNNLAGYAEGGGPPEKCIHAMYPSLQEGYCKALR